MVLNKERFRSRDPAASFRKRYDGFVDVHEVVGGYAEAARLSRRESHSPLGEDQYREGEREFHGADNNTMPDGKTKRESGLSRGTPAEEAVEVRYRVRLDEEKTERKREADSAKRTVEEDEGRREDCGRRAGGEGKKRERERERRRIQAAIRKTSRLPTELL